MILQNGWSFYWTSRFSVNIFAGCTFWRSLLFVGLFLQPLFFSEINPSDLRNNAARCEIALLSELSPKYLTASRRDDGRFFLSPARHTKYL